ncbi:MAG: M23 family metallopeptidase [Chitinophagaceae bacterium]|nr:M23 family metallopeptidase [Chitinophagaceae bacterium]
MKSLFVLVFITCALNSFGQLTNEEIMLRKTGGFENDTSYVYAIPYKEGQRFLFIQGANSKMSHTNELSFDFKMKVGSEIRAARAGVITVTRQDSDKGGLKSEYMNDGNHIIIRHEDGSSAYYWHLKQNGVVVNVGDTVKQGQTIGYSGNTGYSAFPHLHFQVVDRNGKQVLPRFQTKKGIRYLRPGRWYKSM